MASYEIKSIIQNDKKFCCMVSFNNNPDEYYEVESFDKNEINETLQNVANDLEALNSQSGVTFS